jgi:hypothetical protein
VSYAVITRLSDDAALSALLCHRTQLLVVGIRAQDEAHGVTFLIGTGRLELPWVHRALSLSHDAIRSY